MALKDIADDACLPYAGDLTPRHMEIFSNNSYFKGISIPEPAVHEALCVRYSRFSHQTVSFLEVRVLQTQDLKCQYLQLSSGYKQD